MNRTPDEGRMLTERWRREWRFEIRQRAAWRRAHRTRRRVWFRARRFLTRAVGTLLALTALVLFFVACAGLALGDCRAP